MRTPRGYASFRTQTLSRIIEPASMRFAPKSHVTVLSLSRPGAMRQKLNSRPGRIHSPIQESVLAFNLKARQKNSWVDSGSGSLPSE